MNENYFPFSEKDNTSHITITPSSIFYELDTHFSIQIVIPKAIDLPIATHVPKMLICKIILHLILTTTLIIPPLKLLFGYLLE